jgi:hypothetical protein
LGLRFSDFLLKGDGNAKSAAGGKLKSIMAVPENSGLFAKEEFKPEFAVRGKLKEVAAGNEGTLVCKAAGSMKSGPDEENFLPTYFPLTGRLRMREPQFGRK